MKNLVEHNEFVPWRYILAYWHASSNMHVPYVRYHNPLLNTNRTNTDVILWKILLENKEIDFKNGAINIQAPGYIAACISISLLDCSSTLYQIQCTDWGWSPMLTWEGVWPNSLDPLMPPQWKTKKFKTPTHLAISKKEILGVPSISTEVLDLLDCENCVQKLQTK